MTERVYSINELKSLIKESATEFKAKVGDKVNEFNKKENSKTYKETNKKLKDFDGGGDESVQERNVPDKEDGNKTTLDYEMSAPVGKDFQDKVKAQAEGYTSTLEKNNGIEKSADFSDKTYKQFKKSGEEMAKNKVLAKKSGLTARELPDSVFEKPSLYKESKKIAVLNFKNTTFINESQMVSRIPDEYKVDGKRFKVKDSGENEFIVEWVDGEAQILSYENKKKLNESIDKFMKLSGYNSKHFFKKSTNQSRLNENAEFTQMVEKSRKIMNANQ